MKLNEFKKPVVNELDLSSFIGDYGSAAARTGLGSLFGKNVLSTQDQMAKDEFIKNFTSRAFSGLQSAINSGLVDPTATKPVSGTNIGTNFGNNSATTPQTTTQTKPQTTTPQKQDAGNNVSPTPAQTRQQKQDAATKIAQDQMANNGPFSKLPANQAAVQSGNVRQQKQGVATQTAQDQMANNGPFSKLPANQAAVQSGNVRQQKQGVATQTAQDQMSPMSKLPVDQFNKTATNTRQKQQTSATQTAQDQMSPMSKLPTDQFNKVATNVRKQKQGVATQTAQGQMSAPQKNIKPDNTIKMPKRNRKPKSKVAESQFYKLNYIFESILAEATMGQTLSPGGKVVGQANQQQNKQNKQTISQYITTFFKQFMTGITITDPTVIAQIRTLAKELEQTYAKDKGKTVLPKLADLGWSVSHANDDTNKTTLGAEKDKSGAEKDKSGAEQTKSGTTTTSGTTQNTQASAPLVIKKYGDIMRLIEPLTMQQKRSILQTLTSKLELEMAKKEQDKKQTKTTAGKRNTTTKIEDPINAQMITRAKNLSKPTSAKKTSVKPTPVNMTKIKGAKKGGPTPDEEAKLQQRIQQAQANQK